MSTLTKPGFGRGTFTPEDMLEEVLMERALRLDILGMPDMVPRPFKRRPRPKTAIITHAANVAVEVREWINAVDEEVIHE